MSKSINSVVLTGRLVHEAKALATQGAGGMLKMSIACNRLKEGEVDYFDITYFSKNTANLARYLTKGTMIGVVGRLQQRKWTDKQGQNHYAFEVIANDIQLLGGGQRGNVSVEAQQTNNNYDDVWGAPTASDTVDWGNDIKSTFNADDIPF